MEAVEASKFLMPEKIKKFAKVARTMEIIIKNQVVLPKFSKFFTDPLSKNTNGSIITAAKIESINKRVSGETPERIFWSIA